MFLCFLLTDVKYFDINCIYYNFVLSINMMLFQMDKGVDKTALIKRLTDAGVRPSLQRLEILGFICSCKSHPTADEIYSCLHRNNPTLSRTTVFNSLRLFSEKGLVNDISISSDSTRYDSTLCERHAHFVCRRCGRIFDVPFDMSVLTAPDELDCDSVNVYFKGICGECKKNINKS